MNERIKELAKQAGYRDIFDNDTKARARLEKYTELIVRECMAVAAKQRKPANLNYNPSERFVEDLKQHFGVEE